MSDPTLMHALFGSTLVVARSGTGKTTLLTNIITEMKKISSNLKVLTINVKDDDYKKACSNTSATNFENLDKAPKKSVIVVEDVIHLSPSQSTQLRETLNYSVHHKTQKCFIVTHHVFKTNVFQLLPYFNYVIFTGSAANTPVARTVLSFFKVEKDQLATWLQEMQKPSKNFSFFFFDCTKMQFFKAETFQDLLQGNHRRLGQGGEDDPPLENSILNFQNRFEQFLAGNAAKNEACAIFSIIIHCIPLKHARLTDLTLKIALQKFKKKVRVSLVDYVLIVVNPEARLTQSAKFLHKYFIKHCQIPSFLIRNKHLNLLK
jgi:Cdc6-like AAA superfamily ATPase